MYLSGYLKIHTVSAWIEWSAWKACMEKKTEYIKGTRPGTFQISLVWYYKYPFVIQWSNGKYGLVMAASVAPS